MASAGCSAFRKKDTRSAPRILPAATSTGTRKTPRWSPRIRATRALSLPTPTPTTNISTQSTDCDQASCNRKSGKQSAAARASPPTKLSNKKRLVFISASLLYASSAKVRPGPTKQRFPTERPGPGPEHALLKAASVEAILYCDRRPRQEKKAK